MRCIKIRVLLKYCVHGNYALLAGGAVCRIVTTVAAVDGSGGQLNRDHVYGFYLITGIFTVDANSFTKQKITSFLPSLYHGAEGMTIERGKEVNFLDEKISRRLKALIVNSGKTMEQVAKEMHMSRPTLSKKINGKQDFSFSEMKAFAKSVEENPVKIFFE